jgi:hypothetical protein
MTGKPRIIDGDTIDIAGQRMRADELLDEGDLDGATIPPGRASSK